MNRHSVSIATAVAVLGLSGCGGGPQNESSHPQRAIDLAADRAAAERTVHRWVDDDDCTMMSDRFAAEGFATTEEGRADCEHHEDPGLRAGEYEITSTTQDGKGRARANLRLNEGGTRTYGLVRERRRWLIDTFTERFKGRVGDTFTLRDAYEQDGVPVTVDLRVTLSAIKNNVAPPKYYPTEAGKRWVRARFKLKSRSPSNFSQSTDDFKLIGSDGTRYRSDGAAFQPSLGNGGVDLSQGDVVTGYLGFMVPKNRKFKAIRLGVLSGGAPIEWALQTR